MFKNSGYDQLSPPSPTLSLPHPPPLYLANQRMSSSVQFGQIKNDDNAFVLNDVWSMCGTSYKLPVTITCNQLLQ